MKEKKELRTVLSDVALVKKLVDSLCYSKGGPLPDWDEVYEEHCNATGEIIDERPDLGCVQLAFPDGHKYWYPVKAVSSTLPDLKSSIKTRYTSEQVVSKMTSLMHKELGPTAVDAVEMSLSSSGARREVSENEEWCAYFEHAIKHLAARTTLPSAQAQRVRELERELASSQALVARMQDSREASISDRLTSNTPDAVKQAAAQLQAENEELKMQLRAAEDLKAFHTREFSVLTQKCEGYEQKLRKDYVPNVSPTPSEKRVSLPSLSEFKIDNNSNPKSVTIGGVSASTTPTLTPATTPPTTTPVTTPAQQSMVPPVKDRGQRSVTPPARMSGLGGVRRASTPPARRGTTGTAPKSLPVTPAQRAVPSPALGERRVRRQESIRSTSSVGSTGPVRTRSPRSVIRSPTHGVYGSSAVRRASPSRNTGRDADWHGVRLETAGFRTTSRLHASPSAAAIASRKYQTSFSRSNTAGYGAY